MWSFDFHFEAAGTGFVVVAVESGDDVAGFAGEGGEAALGVAGDADDVRGVVEADALAFGEAVDDEVLRVGGDFPFAASHPFEGDALGVAFLPEVADAVGAAFVEVGVGGNQRRVAVVVRPEAVGDAARVAEQFVGGPETVAGDVSRRAGEGHFAGKVAGFHRAGDILADVEVGGTGMGVPPREQHGVVGEGVADFPVELGNAVVNPSLPCPKENVGIEVVVVLEAVGAAAVGVARLVAVDAEGADAEAHPGFLAFDGGL